VIQNDIKNFKLKLFFPYDKKILAFLDEFSKNIRKHPSFKLFPDLHFLSLWCSKKEIMKIKNTININEQRFARGLILHITPSNLPVNFAYSFIVSLLAGNSNIVKIPSKDFKETEIILETIDEIFKQKKFSLLKKSNYFIKTERESEIIKEISAKSDARMIWGGDNTIKYFKNIYSPPRCLDITFSDRFSFAVIDTKKYMELNDNNKFNLAKKFFYDAYLSSQKACNSPHFLFWVGKKKLLMAQKKFWADVINNVDKKFIFDDIQIMDKYVSLYENIVNNKYIKTINKENVRAYIVNINDKINSIENIRGVNGIFFQMNINYLNDLNKFINKKCQTITKFGFSTSQFKDLISKNNLLGADRIVNFGNAMQFSTIWDGHDLINSLTRIIDIDD